MREQTHIDHNLFNLSHQKHVDEKGELESFQVAYGDIFQVGKHRVMCGDSTKISDVNQLLHEHKPTMIFTDPPYNMSYKSQSPKHKIILNDDLSKDDFMVFIKKILNIIKILNIETYYIWCNWKFYSVLQDNLDYKACIVWAKNSFGMGNGYRHQHEFCLFNGHVHQHLKSESDLWFYDRDTNYMHPTQKPVGLSVKAIKNSSHEDDFILDLFGGSGSTLIGCEYTKRHGLIMELDPKYVKLILNRYYKTFGVKPVKIPPSQSYPIC